MTATPTSQQLANSYRDGQEFVIQLSYLGDGEISLSGRHPYHSTIKFNRTTKQIIFKTKGGYNYYGGNYPQPMMIHLSESAGSPRYAAADVQFTWLASDATAAQYPTFEDDPEPITYEE